MRPAGVTGPLPVFLFFHGGGWVLGDYATHERLLSDLVVGAGVAAVFLHYSRSPDRYNGMIHDFGLLNALAQVPAVRSALRQASAELKRHLE